MESLYLMPHMSLESLQAFMASVECGSFSKAAKKLHKSQATISVLVANLEDDLNTILFDRTRRFPKLTPIGETVYVHVRNMLLAQQDLLKVVGILQKEKETEVNIILSDYIPTKQRSMFKEMFLKEIDGIKTTILSSECNNAIDMIITGKADIAVIPSMESRMNYPDEIIAQRTWFSSELNVFCSKEHSLSKVDKISELHLKKERRIRILNGTTINKAPRNDIFTDSVFRAYSLCAHGFGWCELPSWVVNELGEIDSLCKLSVRPSKKILEFDVIYKNESKGEFVNWFINCVTHINGEKG